MASEIVVIGATRLALCAFAAWGVFGQTSTVRPAFEVASIRPSTPGGPGPQLIRAEDGSLVVRNYPVRSLIQIGWRVRDVQILGGPPWSNTECYDVAAKGEPVNDRQLESMVQTLLEDRFKLSLHREMKELPVYALVVGKDGVKLRESDEATKPGTTGGKGLIVARKIRMSILAQLLSSRLDRPVLDRTGLTARYDFKLEWAPDVNPFSALDASLNAPIALDTSGPSIFDAVQEQLGLKLETQKGPVEVLIIDHVERPSEN